MSTAKDLFVIAMDPEAERPVGQGDLSLALAGAELIDLIAARTVTLDGDRIVPAGTGEAPADRLLAEAASALTRETPYERVEDWLWRRGRDLATAYLASLEAEGQIVRTRGGRSPFGADRVEPADTPDRRRALDRRERDEPVLAVLASAVGLDDTGPGDGPDPDPGDEEAGTVLAAVGDAVMELEAVRQRRSIENAAFANIWRAP
ncbi:Golgi phosphoprotein 3 GPP34 [Streptomyces sp. 3211.6]|uniref:GOLPH3/VPS74 family protein n=1 Tax=Streptomyces TaxID=1883 RepID=UPI0009A50DA7|nr:MULTISPECIES: GPP34 family phosphoprotein [Streptomyces]RKT02438.1 Golgi phosphoprotein 3 GPP34 [Streptomyces sp. 3211.6]RPF43757.1 Golgi phosphoprotein 3 GPP34 [Streptomyces sp. Ag109_G2-6]